MRKGSVDGGEGIAVAVSRFGHDPVPVKLGEDATVSDALAAAGITLGPSEKAYVAGVEASGRDTLEDGDVLSIVTPKRAGTR